MHHQLLIKKPLIITSLLLNSIFATCQPANTTKINYRKIGPAYIVNNMDKTQSVLSVMEWKEVTNKTAYHYFLQLNDIQTAVLLKQKEIATVNDQPINHEQLIGRLGNIFWLLTDSLEGYNEISLEMTATESKIAERNLFMKDNFSRMYNNYLLDEAAQVMYINAENGERYKLYPADLLMKPDDTNSDPAPDNYSYEFAAEYKLYDQYNLKYALSCLDTSNHLLYILGSPTETSQVLSYMGSTIYPQQEEMRQVTVIPYRPDGEKFDYAKNKPFTGEKKYYKAAFLQRKFYTSAWKGNAGERVIFFHSNSTAKATLCIALIDKDGKEKWTFNTAIPADHLLDYLIAPDNLAIWFGGNQPALTCINLTDGKSCAYAYQR